jgi:IS605 OrfB family transposase
MATANRTVPIPLNPTESEQERLRQTLEKYQYCRQKTLEYCWNNPKRPSDLVTSKSQAEKALYHELRDETDEQLHGNLVQKAIKDVTTVMDTLQTQWEKGERISKPEWNIEREWSMTYDTKAGTFSKHEATFSTTTENVTLRYETPSRPERTPYGRYVLSKDWQLTTSKLVHDHGQYWIHLGVRRELTDQHWTRQPTVQVSNTPREDASRVLGVDLNVKGYTAVTSAGGFHGNADYLNHRRTQYEQLRGELQETGTKSAYLRLQERSGTESAWFDQYAHEVANTIIQDAIETRATHIVFENLKGIRKRMSNLPKYQQWAFGRVQEYVEYKAIERGIKVVFVKPENTSKKCSFIGCEHSSDGNRCGKEFECTECSRSWNADYNAARNIGLRWLKHNVVPTSRTCSSGKAKSQLALMSGVLSVEDSGASHCSKDWMSTDKPTVQLRSKLAVGD